MDRGEAELQDIPDVLKTQAIFLREDETGDTIECRPQQIASIQGKKYLIAVPKDVAVAIAMVADEDYIPVPPDDELMGYLFPLVADDCKEAGLTLKRTPACLTLEGLPEDHPEEDVEDVDEDEEGEEVSLIAQFALEDDEVALVKYLTPRMLLCEGPVKGEENVYRLLGPEEEMDVMMEVETIMDQRFEEMGEELKT